MRTCTLRQLRKINRMLRQKRFFQDAYVRALRQASDLMAERDRSLPDGPNGPEARAIQATFAVQLERLRIRRERCLAAGVMTIEAMLLMDESL